MKEKKSVGVRERDRERVWMEAEIELRCQLNVGRVGPPFVDNFAVFEPHAT